MIYFTIPSSSGLTEFNIDIPLDRNINKELTLNLLTQTLGPAGFSQEGPNGINIKDEVITINMANQPIETAMLINNYFNYIKTGNITIVFPEGSKNYYVSSWQILIKNLLYANVTARLELMYL